MSNNEYRASLGDLDKGDIIMVTGWASGDLYADPAIAFARKQLDEVRSEVAHAMLHVAPIQHAAYAKPLFIVHIMRPFALAVNLSMLTLELRILDLRTLQFKILSVEEAKLLTDSSVMEQATTWLNNRAEVAKQLICLQSLVRSIKPD